MPIGSVSPFRPTGTVSVSAGVNSANVALSGVRRLSCCNQYDDKSRVYSVRFGSYRDCVHVGHANLTRHSVDPSGQQPNLVCSGYFTNWVWQHII
jgi:hypothetical protein